MAGKFFNKILDVIGLEEDTLEDEELYEEEEEAYEEPAQQYYEEDYEIEQPQSKVFGRNKKQQQQEKENKVVNLHSAAAQQSKYRMIVYQPVSYDDTQNIIDNLKAKKPVIVNLESLDQDVAQRTLDFMSGAVYALNGNIHKISRGIFVLAPTNVDISGNIPEELKGKNFFNIAGRRDY